MRTVNACKVCRGELNALNVCPKCQQSPQASAILIPFNAAPRARSRAGQISTIAGAVLILLTVAIGAAYSYHGEILQAVRGAPAPDLEAAHRRTRVMVELTLRDARAKGIIGSRKR